MNETPETEVQETPEVSRRRKIVAAVASGTTTVALTIAMNVAIGLASQKVTDLITQNQNKKA